MEWTQQDLWTGTQERYWTRHSLATSSSGPVTSQRLPQLWAHGEELIGRASAPQGLLEWGGATADKQQTNPQVKYWPVTRNSIKIKIGKEFWGLGPALHPFGLSGFIYKMGMILDNVQNPFCCNKNAYPNQWQPPKSTCSLPFGTSEHSNLSTCLITQAHPGFFKSSLTFRGPLKVIKTFPRYYLI